jgi:hypothetical protein
MKKIRTDKKCTDLSEILFVEVSALKHVIDTMHGAEARLLLFPIEL